VNFGVPVTEVDYLRSGGGFRHSQLNIGQFVSECVEFDEEGNCIQFEFFLAPVLGDPLSYSLDFDGNGVLTSNEREFDVIDWTVSWTRDSRNHFLNPSRGSAQSLTLQMAKYWPIWGGLVFSVRGNLGYGDSYDSYDKDSLADPMGTTDEILSGNCDPTDLVQLDTGLPFYEHFYSGGVRDLRGYDDNTLGPKDAFCRSIGGDLKVAGGMELAFPTPFVGNQSGTRIALFVDTGYVYENINAFEVDKLRGSFGLSVTWEAPIGPIVISYAFPFRDREGDRTEDLQFSFGTTF
jgi:outer membrane protein insertion porin family